MFDFFDNLCGCFSPQIKRNIIEYLSSANLNRNLMEQEKTNEDVSAPKESIYSTVKTKSYYFMKLKEEETEERQQKPQIQSPEDYLEGEDAHSIQQANWYPKEGGLDVVDQVYKNKLRLLRKILSEQIGPQYSKVYDSQDQTSLKIFCKPQIYQSKRFNSYRFTFKIPRKQALVKPADFLNIEIPQQNINLHQPLLSGKQKIDVSEGGVEMFHRKYKKVLVISQHQFYTAEKAEIVEEDNKDVVYNTMFSVKGEWNKLPDYSRGWINLSGLKISSRKQNFQGSTSLRQQQQQEQYCQVDGYINCELQISVNANMLKQPIAKQIRVYVQKLMCSLSKSDAI